MPRRNRRNGGHQANKRLRTTRPQTRAVPPPPAIERAIVPHGRCHLPHKKLKFTKDEAPKALVQAQRKRQVTGNGHAEKRVYECKEVEGGCGMWHLTSRAAWQPRPKPPIRKDPAA